MRDTVADAMRLRFHFHNTRNTGFANAYAAVTEGVDVLDASAGGIGGCPFAPKATGNIATDDLVYMLERMGRPTGIDLKTLIPTSAFLASSSATRFPPFCRVPGLFP
jgi:isopropylmalate/homocitrate/citramalate synthase